MCGIAGYSLASTSRVDRTLAAQALLAGIAERGADAVGYAYRLGGEGPVTLYKQRSGATALLDLVDVPDGADEALVHVREFTKGRPTLLANNHPIRHGSVVGIHNGRIANDDELLRRHGIARAERGMTVDSEAIFALADRFGSSGEALELLRGSMATSWIDERVSGRVYLARGVARPLWIGSARREIFFASTKSALEVVEGALRLTLRKREIAEGRMLHLEQGRVAGETRFQVDRSYANGTPVPPAAPHERASCLARLAVLAA